MLFQIRVWELIVTLFAYTKKKYKRAHPSEKHTDAENSVSSRNVRVQKRKDRKEYYRVNKARIKKQRHAYYLANRDRIIEASKEYYRSHREEISTVNKEYYNAYNASGTRQGLIDALEEMHEYLGPDPEDQELKGFTESCIEKLKAMTDEEYRGTDLSSDLDKFIE